MKVRVHVIDTEGNHKHDEEIEMQTLDVETIMSTIGEIWCAPQLRGVLTRLAALPIVDGMSIVAQHDSFRTTEIETGWDCGGGQDHDAAFTIDFSKYQFSRLMWRWRYAEGNCGFYSGHFREVDASDTEPSEEWFASLEDRIEAHRAKPVPCKVCAKETLREDETR